MKSHDGHTCSHGNHHSATSVGKRSRKNGQMNRKFIPCYIHAAKEEFYPVAMRPRHSPYPLLSVDEALQVILENIPEELSDETRYSRGVAINDLLCSHGILFPLDALDCVLAESIVAKQPFPPFQASIKDGYAVISQSLSVTCTCRKLIFQAVTNQLREMCLLRLQLVNRYVNMLLISLSPLEEPPLSVSVYVCPASFQPDAGQCVVMGTVARITTGAPLPPGADAVVMVENTELLASSDDVRRG